LDPYLSIIISGRNDDYGGSKYFQKKHETFIKYYTKYLDKNSNFLEIVVVDYNQVTNRKPYIDQFEWNEFKLVKNVVIPNSKHKLLTNDSEYPFYGNIAFNEGLRVASGEFVLTMTIDAFLSLAMIKYLLKKRLDENSFYRTDLYYFTQKYFDLMLLQRIWNRVSIKEVARRHSASKESELTIKLKNRYQKFVKIPRSFINHNEINNKKFFQTRNGPPFPESSSQVNAWLEESGLHTNASGDFILAARSKWLAINGFSEDLAWNLHVDSMALGEFCALGMKQVLFTNPLIAFHALHDRGGWVGVEQVSWTDWCKIFTEVMSGRKKILKRHVR
jgi:hypothetical protein